jgi:hypothetical protein
LSADRSPTTYRRVIRTEKRLMWPGGIHPHVAALVLDDGKRVDVEEAIWRIDIGAAAFCVWVDGQRADVEVHRCARCAMNELQTSRDTAARQHLLALPD